MSVFLLTCHTGACPRYPSSRLLRRLLRAGSRAQGCTRPGMTTLCIASLGIPHHLLIDGAEDGAPQLVQHLDAHAVAEREERRPRLALEDRLHGPHLGKAGVAGAALVHRPAGLAALLIGDRARADDAAGP